VLWLLTWRHAEAHAAVLLCPRAADARALHVKANPAVLFCSGWRGARQKRTPPCCCALADMAEGGPPGEGGLFDPPEGGGGGAWAALAVALRGRWFPCAIGCDLLLGCGNLGCAVLLSVVRIECILSAPITSGGSKTSPADAACFWDSKSLFNASAVLALNGETRRPFEKH
jgi:hypothetical protein